MTPPVINCPEDVTVNTDPGLYYATVNISMPTAFGTYIQGVPTSFRGQIKRFNSYDAVGAFQTILSKKRQL